jgi:hypothetical protein
MMGHRGGSQTFFPPFYYNKNISAKKVKAKSTSPIRQQIIPRQPQAL